MTTHLVRARSGVDIAVHDLGGAGSVLLVVHATGFCGRMYEPLASHLVGHHRVVAIDVRGHGSSGVPAGEDFGWDGFADDLLDVVDDLEHRGLTGGLPLHGFGHSMGGSTVLRAEIVRPGTFATAYVFEPIVFPRELDATASNNAMATAARSRRPVFPSRVDVLWRYSSRPPLEWLRADVLHRYVLHGFRDGPDGSVRLACDPEHEAQTFECRRRLEAEELTGLTMPVVVAVGNDDPERPGPRRFADAVVEALPNGRLEVFDNVGHFGPFQDPHGIALAVLALTAA